MVKRTTYENTDGRIYFMAFSCEMMNAYATICILLNCDRYEGFLWCDIYGSCFIILDVFVPVDGACSVPIELIKNAKTDRNNTIYG